MSEPMTAEQVEEFLRSQYSWSEAKKEEFRLQHAALRKWTKRQAQVSAEERAQHEVAEAIDRLRQGLVELTKGMYRGDQGLSAMTPATDALGDAASGVGKAMILLGGRFAKLTGIALQAAGPISGYLSRASAQADRQFETYQKLSKSGATMSGSMRDLIRDSKRMGYLVNELDKFENLVSKNSKELAQFGGTADDGRRIMAQAGQVLYQSKGDFMQMGITFDEANEYLADFIKIQNLHGINNSKTLTELTEASRDYILEQNIVNQLTGLTREDARKNREESSRNEIFQAKKQELISRGRQDLANRYDRLHDMVASNYSSAMAKAFDESVGFMGAYTEDANKLRMSGNANLQKNLELMEAGQIDEYEVFQRINEDLASTLGEGGIDRGLLQTNDRNFISLADSAKAKALSERKVAEQATKLRDQQRKILGGQGDANTRRYSEMLEAQRDMSAALQDFNDLFDSVFEPIFTSWTDILTVVTKKLTGFVSWMSMDTKYKLLSAIPTIFTGGAIGPNTAAAIIKQNQEDQKPPAPETSTKRETTPAPASAPAEVREPPIATSASDSAIKMIAGFETFQPRAYRDNKQYSIGYGTKTDDPDEIAGRKTITESDAMSRLQSFVNNVTPTVGSMAKKKHWGQNQFDAMVSFTYNLGPGALGQVTENGNRTNQQIANKIPEYNHGEGGKVMPGLTRRRSAEQSLFMTNMPQFAQGGITSGPSIAGEAGPEAVIPLTHGPITVDLGKTADFLSSVQKLVRSDTGAAKYSNDFQPAIAEATEIYQAPNPVEQEILSILRSIGRNSSDLATNNRKIHRAQVN